MLYKLLTFLFPCTVALSMADQAAKPLARPIRVSLNYRDSICSVPHSPLLIPLLKKINK